MDLSKVTIASSTLASAIQKDYKNAIGCGRCDEEALAFATRGFQQLAVEDTCTAYCALALIMHQLGRLNDTMKQKVIKMIDAGGDLAYWQAAGADEKTVLKREKELQKVKDKIMSEQGAPKKVMSPFCMRCDFHVGDVIAYPLDEQKTNYAVFVVVALHHQISRITALSQDRLYVCFHDALFDHLPSKDECQSLRYMELAADAQDRIKRFVRELYLPNKSAAARFFANCTKISYRHDVFESVDEREDIILNVKTFEETLPAVYENYQGNSEVHMDRGENLAKTGKKVKSGLVKSGRYGKQALIKSGQLVRRTWKSGSNRFKKSAVSLGKLAQRDHTKKDAETENAERKEE